MQQPIFVIGMGEVGTRLATALERSGRRTVPVTREAGWGRAPSSEIGTRLICVREEALAGVLERLSTVPDERLVAVQNGWIRPMVPDNATRGLIWFTSKGDFYRPLRPSPFTGPLADDLAAALEEADIPATSVDATTFARMDADKMGFNCVVGLPLAVHGLSLGDYLEQHPDEARAVFTEAVTVCARAGGVEPDADWWPMFLASVEPLHWVATSKAKALELRNGAVVELGRQLGIDTPENERLLNADGA